MSKKKKYCQVGIGSRSAMFLTALMDKYKETSELAGVCDINLTRMNYQLNRHRSKYGYKEVKQYPHTEFEKMIDEQKPDTVIVTSMDRTHDDYICRAMEKGCDIISEKPMTTDEKKCRRILETAERTGRDLRVTFNYRYSPAATKVREIIDSGDIGDVLSVNFEWLLDTKHGADYFRRWHRDKVNSGGLLVHKSTHHFDLVNWWTQNIPETVFAFGRLGFYGRENAEKRGVTRFYERAHGSEIAGKDPFALHLEKDDNLKGLYLEAEHEDGYHRDQSVFGYNIGIEDSMSVNVRYRSGMLLSYSLNAHSPWEGLRVGFNGSRGRLEYVNRENTYVSGAEDDINLAENRDTEKFEQGEGPEVVIHKHWKKPLRVKVEIPKGGHGGGDQRLLEDIFGDPKEDPYKRAAGKKDGALSILTGIAANRSIASGLPVEVDDLLKLN
ncbi:MAG: Gfo/Idh/MocA family oxidoreductase [Fibrobacterota bacterium]